MLLQHDFCSAIQRRLNCLQLMQYINAIAFLVNHLVHMIQVPDRFGKPQLELFFGIISDRHYHSYSTSLN
jgi:hypothetical protein